MREAFQEELDHITVQLVEMTRLAGSALNRATTALLDADLELAESVIAADEQIDAIRRELDDHTIGVLARQQPVATDLRTVVTGMRMSADLERMGDLARHIAKVARMRYPSSAVPVELRDVFMQMGAIAERMVLKAGTIIAAQDLQGARALEDDDDAMDALHRQIFRFLLEGRENAGNGTGASKPAVRLGDVQGMNAVEVAVDATLLGRYYERYADHAVSVAHRVVYLVTGEWHDQDQLEEHLEQREFRPDPLR